MTEIRVLITPFVAMTGWFLCALLTGQVTAQTDTSGNLTTFVLWPVSWFFQAMAIIMLLTGIMMISYEAYAMHMNREMVEPAHGDLE